MSNTDNMRVLALVSTQLTHDSFIAGGGRGRLERALPAPSVAVDLLTNDGSVRMTTWTGHFGPASLQIDAERRRRRSPRASPATSRSRSGGVSSSRCPAGSTRASVAALCVAALGKDRVFGLHMPERESSSETIMLSRMLADSLGIDSVHEDISPILEGAGCYRRRDDAIRKVCSDYGPGYKSKIVLPSVIDSDSFRLYSVVVMAPDGTQSRHRLTPQAYLGIVAATNFKQRVRKMLEYYHADRLNYAVAGTPNRLEYDQGFFVKLGDGSADVKPIAHLYKSQVYAAAGVPGRPGGDPVPSLHHRHLLPAAVAGGVLLLAAASAAWTCACSARTTACPSRTSPPRPA